MGNITGTPDFTEGFNNSGIKHLEVQKLSTSTGQTSGSALTVIFDDEITNSFTGGEYSTSTGVFTASEAGFYHCSAVISVFEPVGVTGDILRGLASFNVDAAVHVRFDEIRFVSNQDLRGCSLNGSAIIKLNAAQTLEVSTTITTDAAVTWDLIGNATGNTYLSITKIG